MPALPHVALTAPYFHTGKVATPDEAVGLMFDTQSDIKPSKEQVSQVVAFLNAQTGKYLGKPLNELTAEDVAPVVAPAPIPAANPPAAE